jgi:predicted AAA+ superfamily ATPase
MDLFTQEQVLQILRQFNPWWQGPYELKMPLRRTAYNEIRRWVVNPPSHRAALVTGARRVGKTTLLKQLIEELISSTGNIPSQNILYLTMDHPILKLAGLENILNLYLTNILGHAPEPQYIFIDEIQFVENWETYLKLMVDLHQEFRIVATGSSTSLRLADKESGVGRWHVIKVPTLSFYEYLKINSIPLPEIEPDYSIIRKIFRYQKPDLERLRIKISRIERYFPDYILKGGFPETARIENVRDAQQLLREDVVDKVLKRDLTVLFGVRNVLDVEKLFLYLCINQGGIFDSSVASSQLGVSRPSLQNYLNYLEDANLIYKLSLYNIQGKKSLSGRYKYYLVDASLANAVLLRGPELMDNASILGSTIESSVFKHIFTRYYSEMPAFGYWRDKSRKLEVDIIVKFPRQVCPFEVKYSSRITNEKLFGLWKFIESEKPERAYVISRDITDFEVQIHGNIPILIIPAFMFCYLSGLSESVKQ